MTIPWMMNCAHTGDGWCLACVKELGEEAARLRETVAKLPKCWRLNDEGVLVQDVPVVPGMEIWEPDGKGGYSRFVCGGVYAYGLLGKRQGEDTYHHFYGNCYSTPQAAEHARQEKP